MLTRLFTSTAKDEEELGKDLYDFSTSEIIDLYKSFLTASLERLANTNSQLKIYTAWCLAKALVADKQNHYEEINNEILLECIDRSVAEQKIISRDELFRLMSELHNVSDQFLILAMFEGICGKEFGNLTRLKYSDFYGNSVHMADGNTIEVSDKLVLLAKKSSEEYKYYCFSDGESGRDELWDYKYDANDDHILKKMYNASYDDDNNTRLRKRLYSKLVRIREYTGSSAIASKALLESGRIQRIKDSGDTSKENIIEMLQDEDMIVRYGRVTSVPRYLLKYQDIIQKK